MASFILLFSLTSVICYNPLIDRCENQLNRYVRFDEPFGFISPGFGFYSLSCKFLIEANDTITLVLLHLDLEPSGDDYITVYNTSIPNLGSVVMTLKQQGNYSLPYTIFTNSSSVLVNFFVSPYYNYFTGFVMAYYSSPDHIQLLGLNDSCIWKQCMNNGTCYDNECHCQDKDLGTLCDLNDLTILTELLSSNAESSLSELYGWGNFSLNYCSWEGVYCYYPGKISQLTLNGIGLANFSRIPFALENLDLRDNALQGKMPFYWFENSAFYMSSIYLMNNMITGSIPKQIISWFFLAYFNVSGNHMSHEIPSLVTILPIYQFGIDNNEFSGISELFLSTTWSVEVVTMQNNMFWCPIYPIPAVQLPVDCFDLLLEDIDSSLKQGSTESGLNITFKAHNLFNYTTFKCYLDIGVMVDAVIIENEFVECILPPLKAGTVNLTLTYNGYGVSNAINIDFVTFCPTGLYLSNNETCELCPQFANCPGNRTRPFPSDGYYRSQTFPDTAFLPCENVEACKVIEPYIKECNDGYEGFLCSNCKEGFQHIRGACVQCPQGFSLILLLQFLSILLAISCILYLLYSASRGSKYHSLAISIEFAQRLYLVVNFSNSLFKQFKSATGSLDVVSLNIENLKPKCTFQLDFLQTWVFFMTLPFLMFLVTLFFTIIMYFSTRLRSLIYRNSSDKDLINYGISAFISFNLILYIPISKNIIEMLLCKDTVDYRYLVAAPYIQCDVGIHSTYKILSYFLIVVYMIGIPVICLSIVYYHRNQLQDATVKKRFGLIYNKFAPEVYLWKGVEFLVTVLISILNLFLSDFSQLVAPSVTLVLLLQLVLESLYHPFHHVETNDLSKICNVLLINVCFSAVVVDSFNSQFLLYLIDAWLIITTMGGVCYCVFVVVQEYLLHNPMISELLNNNFLVKSIFFKGNSDEKFPSDENDMNKKKDKEQEMVPFPKIQK